MANLPTNDAFPELKNHAAFNTSFATFEDLMLKGAAKDTWINICEKVGQFLATTKNNFNGVDVSKALQNESISIRSVLGNWIEKINNFSDDDIKTIVPAGRWDHLNLERFRKRGKEAAELIGQSNNVNLGNLVTRNVQLLSDQQNVQINFSELELVYGPLGLETATFIADVLVKYHQQLRLEHNIRYITSDCAKSFGRAFDSTMNSKETDRQIFWAQTSLLAGWEIIRRVTDDETLREWSRQNECDLVDVFDAGLRLIYNEHIVNVGFMIVIALAEIF